MIRNFFQSSKIPTFFRHSFSHDQRTGQFVAALNRNLDPCPDIAYAHPVLSRYCADIFYITNKNDLQQTVKLFISQFPDITFTVDCKTATGYIFLG